MLLAFLQLLRKQKLLMASLFVALGLGLDIVWINWLVLHLLAILLAFLFFYLLEKLSLSATFFLALL